MVKEAKVVLTPAPSAIVGVSGAPIKKITKEEVEDIPIEDRAKQLPKPSGYRILCAVPDMDLEYESGLVKADETVKNEEILTTVLFVVALGPDCYMDKKKFPTDPWCKEGDFVLIKPHAGSRLIIHGKEFRIIFDDSVEGVVQDPRGIKRA